MTVNTASLDKFMGQDDWAIIFDQAGNIKGLFIPSGHDEEEVPDSILMLLKAAGIDMTDPDDIATVH